MFRFLCVLALISLSAAASIKEISPNVVGVRPCGGGGRFLALRIPGCTNQPCTLVAGQYYHIEFDFEPHRAGPHTRLTVAAVIAGIPIDIINTILPGDVSPGQGYTLEYDLITDGQLVGQNVPIRASLFAFDNPLEICVEFDVIIVAGI